MPPIRFAGPCKECGRPDSSGYYKKHLCNACYKKAKRRARGLQRPGNVAKTGPCTNCGSMTSSSGRFIKGLCYPCYKRIHRGGNIIPRTRNTGPCVVCGSLDPKNARGRFVRGMCRSCYKAYIMSAVLRPPKERLHGTPVELTKEQWLRVLELYNGHCAYCHETSDDMTLDHVIPLSKGGRHHISNVVPACRACNGRKGAGPPPHFVITLKE